MTLDILLVLLGLLNFFMAYLNRKSFVGSINLMAGWLILLTLLLTKV